MAYDFPSFLIIVDEFNKLTTGNFFIILLLFEDDFLISCSSELRPEFFDFLVFDFHYLLISAQY